MQEHHLYIAAAGVVLELLGGVLFIANWTIGAILLLLYTLFITPVVHDFWNSKDESVRGVEIILFFKVATLPCAFPFQA